MLPGFAATMLKLPRQPGQQRGWQQPQQPPAGIGIGDTSPRAVLGGLPLPSERRKDSRADRAVEPQDGHAQDVLRLLNAGWFGPLSKSKAAALFSRPPAEPDAPPPPPSRRGRQRTPPTQQQQPPADRASDASPSTSSQRSGSSSAHVAGGTQAILTPQQRQQQAVQDLPGIGTWAGRYRLFGPRDKPAQAAAAAADAAPSRSALPAAASGAGAGVAGAMAGAPRAPSDDHDSPVVLRPGGYGRPAAPAPRDEPPRARVGSSEAQEHAWRWRFSRKWATEQKRYYEAPDAPASLVSDDLDAMEFTQACGTGLNLQVMPTSAPRAARKAAAASADEEGALGIEASGSTLSLCQFDVDHSETGLGLLSAEVSPGNSAHGAIAAGRMLHRAGSGSGARGPLHAQPQAGQQLGHAKATAPSPRLPSATKSVMNMASKAQELLRQQGAIEAEVQERWERSCTASDAWAGRHLRGVQIDMWGRFKYCVLRVSDGAGHTRFIVRGRNGVAPVQLLEAASMEAAEASRSGTLPAATVEVVGAGVMEWREDTERELHLIPTSAPPNGVGLESARSGSSGDSPTKSPYLGDVSGLTASLVRQALPCHFRITTATSGSSRVGPATALLNRM